MRRLFLRAVLGLIVLAVMPLTANAAQPFDSKAFQQAQAAGKTILVDVWASWCPICRAQQPTLQSISAERPNLVMYRVDFDKAKDVVKRFGAQRQSTLIVFKGSKEVGRSTGETDPDRIRALVAKGL